METWTTLEREKVELVREKKGKNKGGGGEKERCVADGSEVRKCRHSGRARPEKHHVEVEGPAGAT